MTTLVANSVTSTHAYNGMNTRVSRTVGSTTNTFTRDGVGVTSPLMRETSGTAYTPGVSYHTSSTTTFQHYGLKNTQWETSATPSVSGESEFDAFGNEVGLVSLGGSTFAYGGGHGYQSDASGLQLLGHRWYDPTLGRFITRDPAMDGRNWYTYCGNEPVGRVDSNGHLWLPILAGVAIASMLILAILEIAKKIKDGKERSGATIEHASPSYASDRTPLGSDSAAPGPPSLGNPSGIPGQGLEGEDFADIAGEISGATETIYIDALSGVVKPPKTPWDAIEPLVTDLIDRLTAPEKAPWIRPGAPWDHDNPGRF